MKTKFIICITGLVCFFITVQSFAVINSEQTRIRDQLRPKRTAKPPSWEVRFFKSIPWETTGNPNLLKIEENEGARILKYSDGKYIHTIHRQYLNNCGPASLAMILKYFNIARPPFSRGLKLPGMLYGMEEFIRQRYSKVNVGYYGSMEHIMWLGYNRKRMDIGGGQWNADDDRFMSKRGLLNTRSISTPVKFHNGEQWDYLNPLKVPSWMWYGPPVGWGKPEEYHTKLTGIINYIFSGDSNGPWRDAHPLGCSGQNWQDIFALRRIIKGFIDHNIPFLVGLENGRHINTAIGYRGRVDSVSKPFYLYTADPLDDWGRPDISSQPKRWRRILISRTAFARNKRLLHMILCWNHHSNGPANGFPAGNWGSMVDKKNGNNWLMGYIPPTADPLKDPRSKYNSRAIR